MKKLTCYFVLLLTFFSTTIYANNNTETILVFGDSLSAGYGIKTDQGWVNLLQQKLLKENHWAIINASVSGETSSGGSSRLPALLTKHKPKVVILELGANDGLRGQPLKILQQNLQVMIDTSTASGADVLLVGMQIPTNYGSRYTREFKDIYPQLAEKNKLPLVAFLLDGVAGHSELIQNDGLHPTAEAQPFIVKNIYPALAPLLMKK